MPGHGFIANLESLTGRNRAGKTVFRLPENAKVLPASPVPADEGALVAAVNNDGRLLAIPGRGTAAKWKRAAAT